MTSISALLAMDSERDVRDALVNEAVADVAVGGLLAREWFG